ncbi:MAG: SDR family NAD(P)-dependent oxidoreductase, partial [Oceanicaulis sp.]
TIFNAGGFIKAPVCETSVETFRKTWENAALAGFITGRAAARRMTSRGQGTILFTGATASTRGGSGFTAFSGAKFALKAVAQAMARELGPQGVHVAHIILDGVVSTPSTREWLEDVERKEAEDTVLNVEAIANAYRAIVRQPRSAWTFETDLRPWTEDW